MGQTLSNYDAMLREFYEGALRRQLNSEIKMFDALDRSSRSFAGRKVVFPLHLSRNKGVGAGVESGILPTAGNQTTVECNVTATYQYGRINLTGQAMAAGKHAFAETLAFEIEGVSDDQKVDIGRQTYGEGLGILCRAHTDSHSSSQITVMNWYYEPGHPGGRYISTGQGLSFGSEAGVSANGTASVISVSVANNSGTTYDTITTSATALDISACNIFVFNHPGAASGGDGRELKGLRALVDDVTASNLYGRTSGMYTATVQAVSRATYNKWNGTVIGNSQVERNIDSALIQKAFDQIKIKSTRDVSKIIGEYSVVSAFLDSVSSDRRYASKNFDAGKSGLTYNGVDIIQDLLAPYNELFILGKDTMKSYVLKDFSFANDDGTIIKNVANYDIWEAFIVYYGNIGVEYSNGNAVIRDIKIPR